MKKENKEVHTVPSEQKKLPVFTEKILDAHIDAAVQNINSLTIELEQNKGLLNYLRSVRATFVMANVEPAEGK